MDNIILIGMPGSGKSTVGVLLAKTLGYGFLDTDLTIQQREGALLQEILDQRGLEAFLNAEEAAICSVACSETVIAPGGSAVCRAGAIGHLKELGTVVYLQVSLEELEGRISNMSSRGIARSPGQTLADLYGCPVKTITSDQGPALGAAILAGVGAGVYGSVSEGCAAAVRAGARQEPDREAGARYEPFYQLYRGLYPALRESFHTLAGL